jgi:hypothetical protein
VGCWYRVYRPSATPPGPTPSWGDIQADAPQCMPTRTPTATPSVVLPRLAGPNFLRPGVKHLAGLALLGTGLASLLAGLALWHPWKAPGPPSSGGQVARNPGPIQKGGQVAKNPGPIQKGGQVARNPGPPNSGDQVAKSPGPPQHMHQVVEGPGPGQSVDPAAWRQPGPIQHMHQVVEGPGPGQSVDPAAWRQPGPPSVAAILFGGVVIAAGAALLLAG